MSSLKKEEKEKDGAARTPTEAEVKELERLVQLTARAFYEPLDVVVLDNLIKKRCKVKDLALSQLLQLPQKTVQMSLNRLRNNLIVDYETRNEKDQVVTTQEENLDSFEKKRARSSKTVHTLWYIDYPRFMDMLRFSTLSSLSFPSLSLSLSLSLSYVFVRSHGEQLSLVEAQFHSPEGRAWLLVSQVQENLRHVLYIRKSCFLMQLLRLENRRQTHPFLPGI
jgi:hypothetical protein